jgi:hypothetical protein
MSNFEVMYSIYLKKTERSETTNLQSSIVNIQFRLCQLGYPSFINPQSQFRNPKSYLAFQYEGDRTVVYQSDLHHGSKTTGFN